MHEFAICGERLCDKGQADDIIIEVFRTNKSIRKQKQISDILSGVGTGIILGVIYAPDTIKKTICVRVGLALLCAGWFIKGQVDRKMIGR